MLTFREVLHEKKLFFQRDYGQLRPVEKTGDKHGVSKPPGHKLGKAAFVVYALFILGPKLAAHIKHPA